MDPALSRQTVLADMGRATLRWFTGWWRIIRLGAVLLVLVLSPSSYARASRAAMARHLYLDAAPVLLWFTLLSALIGLVVIRIIVVTASSYGLSQYAQQMVVRVLVLELIPLTAAIFVALGVTLPDGADIGRLRARGEIGSPQMVELLRQDLLPRVLAGALSVLMLAVAASVVTLLLAYLTSHGFTTGALERYTRTVGQVFSPTVTLIFIVKTLLLSLAVSLLPIASALGDLPHMRSRSSAELQALVRLFLVMLLIEAASLVGDYY